MIPTHELLWSCANGDLDESILKADKPKSNCGAGREGSPGFERDNQCAKKDGGESTSGERSKEFDEWFGESKVVDENGDPLVVYHGTTQ